MSNIENNEEGKETEELSTQNEAPKSQLVENTKQKTKQGAKKVLKNKKVQAFLIAHLPLIIIIILIIIAVIILLGIIIFLVTMPGLFMEKIEEFVKVPIGNICGMFSGDSTTAKISKEEVISLAQYLQNMGYDIETYGLGEVKYTDDGKTTNNRGTSKSIEKIGSSVDGKNYLLSYIASDNNTYVLSQYNLYGTFMSAIESAKDLEIKSLDELKENSKNYSTGMINIVGKNNNIFLADNNSAYVRIDREKKQMKIYSKAFTISNLGVGLASDTFFKAAGTLFKIFDFDGNSDNIQWGEVFSYDLENWTARYGKSKELLLALHLSTMMPDLSYEIATSQDFNTKVNINMQNVNMTYETSATKNGVSLNDDQIIELFLNNCLISSDGEKDSTKNGKYQEVLARVEENKSEDEFFKAIWKQIDSEVIQGFNNLWGINFVKAEHDTEGTMFHSFTDSFTGLFNKIDVLDLFSSDEDMYIYLDTQDGDTENIEGNGEMWSKNEIIALARVVYKGNMGNQIISTQETTDQYGNKVFEIVDSDNGESAVLTDIKWPYIESVTKHWFYNEIDFNNTAYRLAKAASKTIDYKPSSDDNVLNKAGITVKLNATLTSSSGIPYQVCEPEATGPNQSIINLFSTGQFYKYDGTSITAQRIANSKAIDLGKSTYKYSSGDYQSEDGEDVSGDSINVDEADKIEKENVSFDENKPSALAAFSILENVHTEAAEYAYRELKELVVNLGYFSKDEVTTKLKNMFLWPIQTDYQYTKWDTDVDEDEYGTTINCDSSETTVVAPWEGIVSEASDSSITIDLTNSNTADVVKLYTYIYNKKGGYTEIDPSIFSGLRIKISNINVTNTNSIVQRGDIIGNAIDNKVQIVMYNIDGSVISDINEGFETYFSQEHNTKYEEIMRRQMQNEELYGSSVELGEASSQGGNFSRTADDSGCPISVYDSAVSDKETWTNQLTSYAKKTLGSSSKSIFVNATLMNEFYDICNDNDINPDFAVVRAVGECGLGYHSDNNYWGIGAFTNKSEYKYDTWEEGLNAFCNYIKQYCTENSSYYRSINSVYNTRQKWNDEHPDQQIDSLGYGKPGTLPGIMSIYSGIPGAHSQWNDKGTAGYGNVLKTIVYPYAFKTKDAYSRYCQGVHSDSMNTTTWEQGEYTAWQVAKMARDAHYIWPDTYESVDLGPIG